ncbi:MAG TPA: nucleotide exchange factor GrpE [Chitinophagaceae bacterium]|nr:nucleotide exchange factor GrpE [Chitinophagaceae bacterium]
MDKKNKYDTSSEDNSQDPTSVNELNGNPESEDTEQVDDEITKLKKELDVQKDKYLRLVAEFDNFKRRNAKERMEMIQTAGKDVITSMLEVLDDFDRAEKQMNTDDIEQIKAGVQLVFNKFKTTLQAKGLKPMESIDTEFDVHKHEAIAEVPVEEESKKGKVIDEIVKGYYLNDKLIRFAKVIVGK